MFLGMIETKSLKMLLKSFHGNYSDLFIKITRYDVNIFFHWLTKIMVLILFKYGNCNSFTYKLESYFAEC